MSMVEWIIFGLIPGFLSCILATVTGRLVLRRVLPRREPCPTDNDDRSHTGFGQ